MKIQNLAILCVAAIACNSACQKAPIPENEITSAVSFTSTIANQVVTKATGNKWENNDAIGVFMKTGSGLTNPLASNKHYVTAAGNGNFLAATPSEEIYYPADDAKVDFIAYYPFQSTVTNNNIAINIVDQSQQNKIDLMYANNVTGINKSNPNAQLNFNHALSKVELNVTAGSGVSSLSGLNVTFNGFQTTAQFDLATGTLADQANKAAFKAKTTAAPANTVAEAIVLPTANVDGSTVAFQIGAETYTWTLPETTTYDAGKKYSYNILLQSTGSENTAVVLTSNIVDWTDVPSGSFTIIKDEGDSTINPIETELYTEDFGTADVTARPKIAFYSGWSSTSTTYSDQYEKTDVRSTRTLDNHIWMPAGSANVTFAELAIDGINTDKATNLKLSFDVTGNMSGTTTFDLKDLKITLNGQNFQPASQLLTASDANKYINITVDLSAATTLPASSKLVFLADGATNKSGIRIDNIVLKGTR